MNISHLANGGGNLKASSVLLMLLRSAQRKLFICNALQTHPLNPSRRKGGALSSCCLFLCVVLGCALFSCTEDDGSTPTRNPETRALSHEDSVQQGLVIDINTAWDGEDFYEY